MELADTFQKLIEDYPKLEEEAYRLAFDQFIARMWTKPSTYDELLQAFLEFTTAEKPEYRKLAAQVSGSAEKSGGSKRKRSRRRRSRRRRKSK